MSLLARIEAALEARHQRSTPWPVGHGAVTTKGATMTKFGETIQGTCPSCGLQGLFVGEGGFVTCSNLTCRNPCAPSEALGVKFPTMTSKAPSSPVGATEGSARPIPPEALNGPTGAAYTDVIRREADRDYFTECIAARDATIAQMAEEIKEAWLMIADLQTGLTEALATIARMRTGRP